MRHKFLYLIVAFVIFLATDVFVAKRMHPEATNLFTAIKLSQADAVALTLAKTLKFRTALPKKVDDMTTLIDIESDGSQVVYVLRLEVSNFEFARVFNDIKANMLKTACDREDYRKLLYYGLTIVISLNGRDGVKGEPITISPQLCGLKK